MPHSELSTFNAKIEEEIIGEGSLFFMENLNFLPSEVMQVEEVQKIEKEEGGETKVKEIITSRKLLMPEIRK